MTYRIMVSESVISWCQKYVDRSSPDIISNHGVRKWFTNLPMTNWTFISSGTDTGSSTRISLCHSGFKGLAVVSSV